MIMVLVQDLTCKPCLRSLVTVTHVNSRKTGHKSIKAALDVVTPISGPLSPVTATTSLSVTFVKWLSDMYHSTYASTFCL
jgi:hypothetical protein